MKGTSQIKKKKRNSKDTTLLSSKFLLEYHLYWEAPTSVRLHCRNRHPNTLAVTLRFPLFYSLIISYTLRLKSLGRLRTQCLLL